MIEIFEGAEWGESSPVLNGMYRDRKRIFVDLLGWDVPVVDGAYEIDQFDDEHAIYVVATNERGEHDGSIRLLPSVRPHVLGNIFPELCDGPVPSGEHIFELSRACLSPRNRAARRLQVRNAVTTAVVEFALLRGIRRFTCIADSGWLSQILSLGWDCRPLGLPREIAGLSTGALVIEIDGDTPDKLRSAGTYVPMRIVHAHADGRAAA
ncbi:putative autoinducer synthesis protein [Sphingobium sp. SYK-6]|uniref:acyl-homoserine-lactone synthase n=1 Tax=Sphingobium sp. (strain NBRC 103272 / SYK-6) TaxID=627192 RepID=UPI00022774FF|nr:acyl-homoserine-lactone synthase [Sphingobium sp. SYK-6]BAK66638.1 putative autoinducer synthesis protein [Sphingobium sp. SYK-6]